MSANNSTQTTYPNCTSFTNGGFVNCLGDFNKFESILDSSTEAIGSRDLDLNTFLLTTRPSPLISDSLTYFLELVIVVFGLYITSIFGLGANVVNLIVYARQGLKDSITLGLFTLSLSDLVLVTLPLITASCHAADYLMPNSPIDFPSIHYVSSGWMRNMMYSMSCLITAFLSLERCCCIILPFKVKSIFTRGKTALFLGIAFFFHLGCLMMLPAAYELTWWPSHNYSMSNNMTRIFRVVFFEEGEIIEVFNTTVLSLVIPTATQVIVLVCVIVMIHGLQSSANFRRRAQGNPEVHTNKAFSIESNFSSDNTMSEFNVVSKLELDTCTSTTKITIPDNGKIPENYKLHGIHHKKLAPTAHQRKVQNNLTGRDARLMKTMIFLVSIQSACNIPFLVATFAWRSIPELNIGMAYENTLRVVFSIVYLLGNLNASCNVFVYYHTSSAFRELLSSMMTCIGKAQHKQ